MNRLKITATISCGLSMALLFLISLPVITQAQTDPVLPPRPTPEPLSTTVASPNGATIMLTVPVTASSSIDVDDWAIVQWQDNHGDWNKVEGWQGNLAYDAPSKSWQVIWWVARANFGEKSFRWAIYTDETMTKLEAVSDTFDLPTHNRQGVVVGLKNP